MARVEILLDKEEKKELEEFRKILDSLETSEENKLLGFIEGVKIARLFTS